MEELVYGGQAEQDCDGDEHDDPEVAEMGWRVGADEPFQKYGARTRTRYVIDMMMQHDPETAEVLGYLYAFKGE